MHGCALWCMVSNGRTGKLRDDLLPSDRYRALWQRVDTQLQPRDACKWMVGVLRLASDHDCEDALITLLEPMMEQTFPDLKTLQARFLPQTDTPCIEVKQHTLASFRHELYCKINR